MLRQPVAKPATTIPPCGRAIPSRNMRNPFVTRSNQKICNAPTTLNVGRGNRAMPRSILPTIEHHHRNPRNSAALGEIGRHRDRGSDDAIHLIVDELFDNVADTVLGIFGHKNKDMITLSLQRIREPLKRNWIKLIIQISHYQPNNPTFSRDHRPRQRIGAIPQFIRRFAHLQRS